jgi:hypothetical protein
MEHPAQVRDDKQTLLHLQQKSAATVKNLEGRDSPPNIANKAGDTCNAKWYTSGELAGKRRFE